MSDYSMDDARVTVHSMERDVLEQWTVAVSDGDQPRVGELVHLAHSLRDVGKALTIGGRDALPQM